MEESASTRVVDVAQQAARWRRLRLRRRVLLLVAPLVCWYAAVVSYTVVGRHLPDGAALVLMVGVAACALGLLVVAARSRHDRSIVVGWRAIELAVRRRRGMALLLILVPVCVWMFLFVGLLVGAELALVMGGLFLPLWLVVAPLWPWLSRLWKRAATSPAADVLRADGRAPVVYLRSFAVPRARRRVAPLRTPSLSACGCTDPSSRLLGRFAAGGWGSPARRSWTGSGCSCGDAGGSCCGARHRWRRWGLPERG
jgi:hypothetical protein